MKPELMSPAGNLSAFIAAVESGADSVYLGLNKFNARRPAQNFDANIMPKVVNYAHSHGCKVYVTLNIDIKPNELDEACRMLAFLQNIGTDAVIVKDLAIIDCVNRFFPKLELHFSTQTAICNSIEVEFAAKQNAKRIVLARELTLDEIKSCTAVAKSFNADIEIFTEGSMCFCISGRCLMSSFIGGRSGNRGACTGCCRIKWTDKDGSTASIFSMKDLSLAGELDKIAEAGVSALKIEGRLKKSGWVREITGIYRHILDKNGDVNVDVLQNYTAREVGTGHLFGHDDIVGENEHWQNYVKTTDDVQIPRMFDDNLIINLTAGSNIGISIDYRGQNATLTENLPPLPKKAKVVEFDTIGERLEEILCDYEPTVNIAQNELNCGLSFINNLSEKIKKICDGIKNDTEKFPQNSREVLDYIKQEHSDRQRKRQLGSLPNRIIVLESRLKMFKQNRAIDTVTVYLEPNGRDDNIIKTAEMTHLIAALPEIIYEHETDYYESRVKQLISRGIVDWEANSWTAIMILQKYDVNIYGGTGLSVMNHKAADYLKKLGLKSCFLSAEADVSVYKAMSAFVAGDIELNAIEFAKIPLFISRVGRDKFANRTFQDKYIQLKATPYGDVNYFTPDVSFSLIDKQTLKDNVFADNLVCDLRFFDNPFEVIERILSGKFSGKTDTFNYRRKLV